MDKLSLKELLEYILESIEIIRRRFKPISTSDDFIDSDDGIDRLDAISMRLQSIGEALKNIYKTDGTLLETVKDDTYWSLIIKLREIISHHYVDIDAEIIYDICQNELDELSNNILKVKDDLQE